MKAAVADFPDWFGPMLVKELRQGLKSRGFVLTFVALQVILILVLVYFVISYANDRENFEPSALAAIFWGLMGGYLIFLTPLRALNELAAERKANTLELIFLSGLSARGIAWGKWLSLLFQATLFVLAILPYAILRYYFGGVNLTEDLTVLALLMLSCAGLTALALALSGLPIFVRIGAILMVVLVLSMAVPALFAYLIIGRSGMGSSTGLMFGSGAGTSRTLMTWLLQIWNAVIFTAIALEVGAGTIAPLAENHAGRQRLYSFGVWLAIPLLAIFQQPAEMMVFQIIYFGLVAAFIAWHHLAVQPLGLRSHVRPFRGAKALIGTFFQPGWPGASLYLLTASGLVIGTLVYASGKLSMDYNDIAQGCATILMGTAVLLCPPTLWAFFFRRWKHALVLQTIFLIFAAVAVVILHAAIPGGDSLGGVFAFAVFPPMAIFTMQDMPYDQRHTLAPGWLVFSAIALGAYFLALLWKAKGYWLQYFRIAREIRKTPRPPLEVPALPEP